MGTVLLRTENIVKTFGPTKAVSGVSISIEAGRIHGLIGENGSGKSTLSSVIAAVHQSDSGKMYMDGNEYSPKDTIDASKQGVCMVVQEQGTFEKLTVAGNIFIGKEKQFVRNGILNISKMNRAARQILDKIGAKHIDEKKITGKLSFEDRKLIEIARAMFCDPNILIIDETTTSLSQSGRDILYRLMGAMKDSGKSVIFISHDIEEVMEYCDCVTVLRDGEHIKTVVRGEFSEEAIKTLMVGREISGNYYRKDSVSSQKSEIVLSVESIVTEELKDISICVYKGEIVGIGGLTECGMHELGKVIFGLKTPDAGRVLYAGELPVTSATVAMKYKIGYLSKDRDKESLMKNASIRDNICLPSLRKLKKGGVVTKRTERNFSRKWAYGLNVKMIDVGDYISSLSGGNKQKVVLAKWMGFGSEVLILDCPTRGIDVGVKQMIYQLLIRLKEEGKAILMISEELTELIGMSDRVIIMKNGKISGEFKREDGLAETKLIQYML